jgi:hypothetical protein
MRIADIRLGMRVRRHGGSSALVQDRPGAPGLKGRRVGIIISLPDRLGTTGTFTVDVQWEASTLSEKVHCHRLEALPTKQQPVALGGQWQAEPDTFIAKPPAA